MNHVTKIDKEGAANMPFSSAPHPLLVFLFFGKRKQEEGPPTNLYLTNYIGSSTETGGEAL
jgi:hypothetical protein